MKKALLFAGVVILGLAATPAAAQWPYDHGPRYGYGYGPDHRGGYMDYFRQLRACQRHDRLHGDLNRAHAGEHYWGIPSRGDHRDLHEALEETHDAYHWDNPRANYCHSLPPPRRGWRGGYPGYGYGYVPYGPGPYGGAAFGFFFGR